MNQPGVVRNEMNLCEAESCLLSSGFFWVLQIHQGFLIVFQCLFLLQLLYQYISVAHTLQHTSESLAGLLKDSWTPLTASDSVGTEGSAFLTITKTKPMLLVQGLYLRTLAYAVLKNSFCVFFFYLKQLIALFKISGLSFQ